MANGVVFQSRFHCIVSEVIRVRYFEFIILRLYKSTMFRFLWKGRGAIVIV